MLYNKNSSFGEVSPVGGSASGETVITLPGFSGLDLRVRPGALPSGKDKAMLSALENLRVLPSGALKKRCGFRCLSVLPGTIRALTSYTSGGTERLYCVAGDGVFVIDPDQKSVTQIYTLSSADGVVTFFEDNDGLDLFADAKALRITPGTIREVAYIPLYLEEQDNSVSPTVFQRKEPLNLLTRMARMSFRITVMRDTLFLPVYVDNVLSVRINGVMQYLFPTMTNDMNGTVLKLAATPAVGDLVELTVKIAERSYQPQYWQRLCNAQAVFCASAGLRRLYFALPDQGMLYSEHIPYSRTYGSVYLPFDNYADPFDDGCAVKSFAQKDTRVLCFTERATMCASSNAYNVSFVPYHQTIGSASSQAAIAVDNAAVTASDGGLFLFSRDSAYQQLEYGAECLSEALGEMSFPEGACLFYDKKRKELWLRELGDTEGRVHILNRTIDCWYDFVGLDADGFFPFGGEVGYYSGDTLYLTDPERLTDERPNGASAAIRALASTHWLGFGEGDAIRRSGSIGVVCHTNGGRLLFRVETDKLSEVTGQLTGYVSAASDAPELIERTFQPNRFHFLRVTVISPGAEQSELYALQLAARR